MNHKELLEILRVYAIVTVKPNLIKLLSDKLTIKQYLENVLQLKLELLPEFEADVEKEKKKLQDSKSADLEHRKFMLKKHMSRLLQTRQKIRSIKRELHNLGDVSNNECEIKITIYESGRRINDGDLLIAKVDNVEGHRRVTLRVVNE